MATLSVGNERENKELELGIKIMKMMAAMEAVMDAQIAP